MNMKHLNLLLFAGTLLLSANAANWAQTVTGTVRSEGGESLPGTTVLAAGGALGTSTDIDGVYRLDLPAGQHTLKFSFIGYLGVERTVELAAGQVVKLNVGLEADAVLMDDVVIVGYGVQRRKEVTGSIAQIDSKQITAVKTPSFEAALQGQAAGVQVSQSSGVAGAPSLVRVRGVASVSASGDPLYVVDGIPITQEYFLRGNSGAMNNNPLATINPNDIESVEILKDAAATGIYGSRGANGVILITTKRGGEGTDFEFSSNFGGSVAATLPNMLNTQQYLTLRQEAWENDGGTGYVWLPNMSNRNDSPETRKAAYLDAMGVDTDWTSQTVGTGSKYAYSFGVRQGGEDYALYTGVSYDHNGSYLLGNSYSRASARMNLDYAPISQLKVIVSSSMSRGINDRIDAAWSGGLGDAMSNALPYYPVVHSDYEITASGDTVAEPGDYFLYKDEWGGTKNAVAVRNSKTWVTTEDRSINNVSVLFTPTDELFIKASGGFDYMHVREDVFNPPGLNSTSDLGYADRYANYVLNWNYALTANYLVDLSEDQTLNFLAGSEFQRTDAYGYGLNFSDVTGPIFENDSLVEAANGLRTVNNPSQHSFLSYFTRAGYTIKDRYFFQATGRVDGSSRFGRNYRYGFFPSVSAGWVVSDEPWFASEQLSFVKLRTSWGKTGNAALPDYARFGTYSSADNGILYNGQPILFPIQPANHDLHWESSRTVDASLELGFWNDRVTAEIGYYNKLAQDVIMNVSTPASTGFTNRWDNVATILNRGVELGIKSRNLVGQLQWTTDLNIARNYNELVDIGEYTPDAVSGGTNDSRVIPGSPVGSFYLMMFSHVDSETGLPVYFDREGNETFDYDNNERQYVGDGLPEFVGGITNTFRYKGWDLQALATFSYGAKIFDSSAKRQLGVVTSWNMRTEILDRWRAPGDEATFPRLTLDETTYGLPSGFPWWNTSLFVFDASYLRMRNVSLGYTFDDIRSGSAEITGLRFSVSVTNLFTITDFPGLDPEVVRDFENAQDRNLSPNVTYLTPPQERAWTFGVSMNF